MFHELIQLMGKVFQLSGYLYQFSYSVSSGLICDTQNTSCFAYHAMTMTPCYSVADPLAKVHWIDISFLLTDYQEDILFLKIALFTHLQKKFASHF